MLWVFSHFLSVAESELLLRGFLTFPACTLSHLFRRVRFIFKISLATSSNSTSNWAWASEYCSKSPLESLIARDLEFILFSNSVIWSSREASVVALAFFEFLGDFGFLVYFGLGSSFLASICSVRSLSSFSYLATMWSTSFTCTNLMSLSETDLSIFSGSDFS